MSDSLPNLPEQDYGRSPRSGMNLLPILIVLAVLATIGVVVLRSTGRGAPDVPADEQLTLEDARAGQELHADLLSAYRDLDARFREPLLWAATSERPLAAVAVPTAEWERTSPDDRRLLRAMAAWSVRRVASDPLRYAGIDRAAPEAARVRERAKALPSDAWAIVTGPVSADGRELEVDRVLVRGR
ncbi:MAG: hypothetical protein H6835_01725 [Planctomycetes bacterium]|nr:hypothetical protein [Planctomycetota bacterium]